MVNNDGNASPGRDPADAEDRAGQPAAPADEPRTAPPTAARRQPGSTLGTPQEAQSTQERREAIHDLGQLREFGDGLYPRAGRVVDAMLPGDGDKGRVQINLNLAVNPSMRISFRFELAGERDAGGLTARVEVGAGVTATVDLWVAEAFAQAMVFGYLEARGDTGEEVFRYLSYAMYDRVAQVNADAADYVWGRPFRRRTRAMMDRDDYVESGLGVDLSGGLSARGGAREAEVGVRSSVGTRITADGRQQVSMLMGELSVDWASWTGELRVQLTGGEGDESGEVMFAVQRTADLLEFASVLEDGSIQALMLDWVAGVIGTVRGMVKGDSGAQAQDLARRAGAIARMVRDGSLGLSIGSAAALRAIGRSLRSLDAASIGQRLTITLGVTPTSISVEADLERIQEIEFGQDERAPVYVLLEDAARILRLGPETARV